MPDTETTAYNTKKLIKGDLVVEYNLELIMEYMKEYRTKCINENYFIEGELLEKDLNLKLIDEKEIFSLKREIDLYLYKLKQKKERLLSINRNESFLLIDSTNNDISCDDLDILDNMPKFEEIEKSQLKKAWLSYKNKKGWS